MKQHPAKNNKLRDKLLQSEQRILFASLATILISITLSMSMTSVLATHDSGQSWGTTSVTTCYLSTGLKALSIDGSTNQIILANAAVDAGRNDWNDEPSVWKFNKGISPCNRTVGSSAQGANGPIAVTTRTPLTGNPLTDNDVRFNKDLEWTSGTTCTAAPNYNLAYVATHEFGHWLRLLDVSTGSPADTIMWYSYNCAASSISAHDSTTLTNIYG